MDITKSRVQGCDVKAVLQSYIFISHKIFHRLEAMASSVLEELVHHEDKENFPISKLSKVWESGVIKAKILDHLKEISKFYQRTVEEAAR